MLIPADEFSPQGAEQVILPSYSHLVASAESGYGLYIFPPIFSATASNDQRAIVHPPKPATATSTIPFPKESLVEILLHFRGPAVKHTLTRNPSSSISPQFSKRISHSLAAHQSLARARPQGPLLPLSSIAEGTQIDMCAVVLLVDMDMITTREAFGRTLQTIAPPPREEGVREHFVTEWKIRCRRCGAMVKHYYTDEHWNGRLLEHWRDPRCISRTRRV